MLVVAGVVGLVVEWEQEAFWDCRAAVAFGHAVGGSGGKFADNPASFFVLMDECDVTAIGGSVVHVNKRPVVVALFVPVLNSSNVASSQGRVCLGSRRFM